ncbi:MAG: hypothetical protein JNL01_07680 [Bdellovibrionales bacterium]|nr:hypothetical protein [Bdellovibrionales bacterium]
MAKKTTPKLKVLWITDKWASLDHPRDTSLRLMEESLKMGWQCWWCSSADLSLQNDGIKVRVRARADQVKSVSEDRSASSFQWGDSQVFEIAQFDQVHLRIDPPVDHRYIHLVQLLNFGLTGKHQRKLVNPAMALLTLNEKMTPFLDPKIAPQAMVACDWENLLKQGQIFQTAVSKPLHQAQSKGVEKVSFKELNDLDASRKELGFLSNQFSELIMLQQFLPGITAGETRIWFVDGKVLATVRKIPQAGEFKIDMDRGSTVQAHTLTKEEKKQIPKIQKILNANQVRLAAIDLIDGRVSDFNVTSPGLIVQMEKVLGRNLAIEVLRGLAG